jgi:NADPH:quinone reductase-like Zn-dependent oxidoreductase
METSRYSARSSRRLGDASDQLWWGFDLSVASSDGLAADSFASPPSVREKKKSASLSNAAKRVSFEDSTYQDDDVASVVWQKDKYSYRGTVRQDLTWEDKNRTAAALLDVLESNMCSFDLSSQAVAKSLRLANIEKQLEKMRSVTRKVWYDDAIAEDVSASSSEDSSESRIPRGPDRSNAVCSGNNKVAARNEVCYQGGDLKRGVMAADGRQSRSISTLRGTNNVSREITVARPIAIRPRMDNEMYKDSNNENSNKSLDAKEKAAKDIIIKKRKEHILATASGKVSVQEQDKFDVPAAVHISKEIHDDDELDQIIHGMSTLTEDDVIPFSTYSSIPNQEVMAKSCIPNFFQKRLQMKKAKAVSTKSVDSFPVSRILSASKSSQSSLNMNIPNYLYDYESTTHSYVAYFQRGMMQNLHLFHHRKPASFNTTKSEVVVKIIASTISPTDNLVRKGDWWGESSPNMLNLPIVPGVAFFGSVESLDKTLGTKSGLKKGDQVMSLVRVGANSRHMSIHEDRLVKVPSNVGDSGAKLACLPEVYLAAFQAIHMGQKKGSRYRKNSLANRSVLILGGSGAMGRALVEVALAGGAKSVYATGREKDFGLILELGGLPLSQDPNHWLSVMLAKVDVVVSVDAPHARPELKYSHVQTLSADGRLVIIGAPDQGDRATVNLDAYEERDFETKRRLHNYNVFDAWEADMKTGKRDLAHLIKLFKDDLIKPQIQDRLPLNHVSIAHQYMETKKISGFILCEPWIEIKEPSAPPSPPSERASKSVEGIVDTQRSTSRHRTDTGAPTNMPLRGDSCESPSEQSSYVPFESIQSVRYRRVLV